MPNVSLARSASHFRDQESGDRDQIRYQESGDRDQIGERRLRHRGKATKYRSVFI
ncbi:MAG: hypothetical protein LBM17_05585 [Candidatus Accumulibacter sp.]|nr:hypothetical protein [Accumulibacter sp.]